jgi:radical SAM protein with 4Fe4S-binding SPASM domain
MIVPSFPKRIEIELAGACNLQCTYCPRRFVEALDGFIDYSFFVRLIDEIEIHPETILVLHRRGESLLHPQFLDIMKYVKAKFKEVQLATNATLLNKARSQAIIESVTFLSFSIDTPRLYEDTRRPAKYMNIEKKILCFLDMNRNQGNPVKTQVSMVKTPQVSAADLYTFKEIWASRVDRVRIYEEHSANGNFGSLDHIRHGRKPCVMPFYEMLIYYDGKIGRCNHDWDGEPLGDLNQKRINEIWHSEIYDNLRRQHQTLKIEDSVCAKCDSWYPEEGLQGTGEMIKK